jgi:glycosyltransferase involved in cell wall biosynthesis
MKSVLFIQRWFVPEEGGASRRIDELASYLPRFFAKQARIVTMSSGPRWSPLGNDVLRIPGNPLRARDRMKFITALGTYIIKHRRSLAAVYLNAPFLEAGPLIPLARKCDVSSGLHMTLQGQDGPMDLTRRSRYPEVMARLMTHWLGQADHVYAMGTGLAQQAIEYGWAPDRVVATLQAKDEKVFHPVAGAAEKAQLRSKFGCAGEGLLVGFAGYLTKRKGIDVLLDAWPEIHEIHPQASLLVAGATMPGDELWFEKLCRNVPGLIYAGPLSQREMGEFYRCLDVFVLPSLHEGIPSAVVEAMMCGLCVISSDLPGSTDDIIEPGKTGLFVKPGAGSELRNAVHMVLGDSSLRHNLAQQAAVSAQRFHLKQAVMQYAPLFHSKDNFI